MPDPRPNPPGSRPAAPPLHDFVFVVHGGKLEAKSALLACSLRQKLLGNQRIVAAEMVPADRWGTLSPAAMELFDTLGVERVPSENLVDPAYPHGNKINAMASIDGPAIFLDSDMMMMRPFLTHYSLLGTDAASKAADIDTFVRGGGGWSRAYGRYGLPLPERTLTATSTGERMRPYYNAGFIAVKNGRTFSECWAETAREIDADPLIHNKRPWLDQVALPIVFDRLGWSVGEASALLNFPAHLEPLDGPLPYIVHYHFPHVVANNPRLVTDVAFYMAKFHALRDVLAADPDWAEIAAGN